MQVLPTEWLLYLLKCIILNFNQTIIFSQERVEEIAMYKTHYVFNNLEQDTDYIVKARVYIELNDEHQFSGWSEEFTFHSGE